MKAAERDARRAEAIRLRPKGSPEALRALGRDGKITPRCGSCGAEMTPSVASKGLATKGICRECARNAQIARAAVERQRAQHARTQAAVTSSVNLPRTPERNAP